MSEINFQELLQGIQDAEVHITEQTGQTMEELLITHYESLPFVLGHMMGMRDCLTIVQNMLLGILDTEIQRMAEEEE